MQKEEIHSIDATVLDSRLIEHFDVHRDFTRVFLDAFALINSKRKVLKFNQMFCSVVGMRAVDVRKSLTIEDLILTEIQGSEKSAIDLIMDSLCPIRIDEVPTRRMNNGEVINLIISSYPYFDADHNFLGACVVMRDVTAETNLLGKYKEKTIQSITDSLTGLFTRRYFEEWLDKEIERYNHSKEKVQLGFLMFDLDKFKSVNDTYGHQAGDFVLIETAKILRENSRKTDIVGRYGGEELIIILSGVDRIASVRIAEKMRIAIQAHDYIFNGIKIPVTSSVGISIFLSNEDNKTDLIKRADACLYTAKKNGRNVSYANFDNEHIEARNFLQLSE